MKTFIAIDPGASGGIAYQHGNGSPAVFAMPDTDGDIVNELRTISIGADLGTCECLLEDLVKYAGRNMPSSAMATYARNFGFLEGVLQALGIRIVRVKPQAWQKALGLGTSTGLTKTAWKNKLKGEAQRRFPQLMKHITLKTADALLLLEYGRGNV